MFFAVAWSGGGLLIDYRAGYLDKLRATPANRYAIIAGELVTVFLESVIMSAVILVITIVLGASIESGIVGAILILLIAGSFGVAWAGTSMAPALLTRNEQATGTIAFLFIPIAFLSTAFVPEVMMPDWLQTINVINPISYVIEAIRSLMIEGIILDDLWPAVVSIIVLGAAAPLAHALGLPAHDGLTWTAPSGSSSRESSRSRDPRSPTCPGSPTRSSRSPRTATTSASGSRGWAMSAARRPSTSRRPDRACRSSIVARAR